MNQEICDRCRLKYSLVKCENCKESFCTECDSYIHSILSKKNHTRKMIYSQPTHDTISKLNLNFNQNQNEFMPQMSPISTQNNNISQIPSNSNRFCEEPYNFTNDLNTNLSLAKQENFLKNDNNSDIIKDKLLLDSYRDQNFNINEIIEQNKNQLNNNNFINKPCVDNKLNKNMSCFCINEIKNIYNCEKKELVMKINELSKELVDTKTNLEEHIDYLNNYIIQLENKYKNQIVDLTLKNSNDLKSNTIKQDTRIKELESELSIEKEKNENLQKKIEEYEKIIQDKKYDIEKLSDEKVFLDKARKTNEDRLKLKISNLEKSYSDEMSKMKNNYETELHKIKSELNASKNDFFKISEENKENFNKILAEKNKEKSYYDSVINKLKEDISNKTMENEKLLNLTRNLQQNNEDLNDQINQMNDEIYNKEIEQQDMLKTINKIKKEKDDISKENSKYHSVLYGRFKNKGKNN